MLQLTTCSANLVSDVAIFVLKKVVKLQLTNSSVNLYLVTFSYVLAEKTVVVSISLKVQQAHLLKLNRCSSECTVVQKLYRYCRAMHYSA